MCSTDEQSDLSASNGSLQPVSGSLAADEFRQLRKRNGGNHWFRLLFVLGRERWYLHVARQILELFGIPYCPSEFFRKYSPLTVAKYEDRVRLYSSSKSAVTLWQPKDQSWRIARAKLPEDVYLVRHGCQQRNDGKNGKTYLTPSLAGAWQCVHEVRQWDVIHQYWNGLEKKFYYGRLRELWADLQAQVHQEYYHYLDRQQYSAIRQVLVGKDAPGFNGELTEEQRQFIWDYKPDDFVYAATPPVGRRELHVVDVKAVGSKDAIPGLIRESVSEDGDFVVRKALWEQKFPCHTVRMRVWTPAPLPYIDMTGIEFLSVGEIRPVLMDYFDAYVTNWS